MLRNAFSPIPRRSQPEATKSEPASMASSTPEKSPSTPPTLSRPASDLLVSGIPAKTLMDAATESVRHLAVAIRNSEMQRQERIDARKDAKDKQMNSTIGRASSFSRPRPVAISEGVGKEVDAVKEIEERLERMRKVEEGLKGDIECLKRSVSQETFGGRKDRVVIIEDEPEQEDEAEEEELGEDEEVPVEMTMGTILGKAV